jgi:hypothetical protein
MKDIVVIFVHAPEVRLPHRRPEGDGKTSRAEKSSINNEFALPFWTWFIENPRPKPSSSFSSLVSLTLAM